MLGFCDKCWKEVEFDIKEEVVTRVVKGVEITATIKRCYCKCCGGLVTNNEIWKENDEIIFGAYRKKMNILSPEQIKAIRNKFNLSQKAFAIMLGLGEKDITRFENGAIPSKAINNLILLADDDYVFNKYFKNKIPQDKRKLSNR